MFSLVEFCYKSFHSNGSLFYHRCFEGSIVVYNAKLDLTLGDFILFVHNDRCSALVCLLNIYFRVLFQLILGLTVCREGSKNYEGVDLEHQN